MVKQSQRRNTLFKKRQSTMPDYTEFLNLLSLHDNKCSNKLLAHIPNENLKIVIYSLQDHLNYITEPIYNKLCADPDSIDEALDKAYHNHIYEENCTIWCTLGVKGCSGVTQSEIAKYTGVSKSEVSRRIKRVSKTIRKCINEKFFPEIQLEDVHTNVASEGVKASLYTDVSTEPSYEDIMNEALKYRIPFNRDSLHMINNRGLRAAVGTFKTAIHLFKDSTYDLLLLNRSDLESIILRWLDNMNHTEANYYKAYWQLGEFHNVKMTAESIAEYADVSVTTIRRKIQNIGNELRIHILRDIKRPDVILSGKTISEPLKWELEMKLITNMCKTLGIQSPVKDHSLSEESLQVLGSLFQHYSLKVAVSARCLLNGDSYEDTRRTLEMYGINECVTDGALRSRKNRFLKSLREDYQVIRTGSHTLIIKLD